MTGDARSRRLRTVAAGLTLVAVAAVAPTLVGAIPANEVPVTDLPNADASLSSPTGEAWGEPRARELALASAPSGAVNENDTTIEAVSVRAARTVDRTYLRLSWVDEAPRTSLGDGTVTPAVNSFPDAAAVQWPANASASPGIAMGSDESPVNVWYWNAETGAEELLAGGPGTTTRLDSTVAANGTYEDDRWFVVFAREHAGDNERRTDLETDRDVQIAFAVWNGTNAERAGQKAVSEWQRIPLGPGPQGPPYETLLWAIAGLAIVVVIVATILGIRRT